MPQPIRSQGTRAFPQLKIDGGLDDTHNEFVLNDSQTPECLNIDFNRDTVATSRGSIKFNNQTAPRAAVRTRTSTSPLYFAPGLSVPLRGYEYLPYDPDSDIGGTFGFEGDYLLGSETFHGRVGKDFQVDVSFAIPPEEKLYEAQTRGLNAPAVGAESAGSNPPHGFDEALDECVCILQKGGDRTAPMSWALAIVNIGNGTGLSSAESPRASNYALCFMWLDAPQWGEIGANLMRYSVASGVDPSTGTYCTTAYRSILIHKYLEPTKRYHVALQLKMDTGSAGGIGVPTAWNADGYFKCFVKDETGAVVVAKFVDSGGGGTSQRMEVHRGPIDSLQYLCRYGIRYSGRDAMFGGLGMRSFPWMKPGFIPYGSDCTSIDCGGFQMVDRSAVTATQLYGGGTYTLTAAHTSGDAYVVINHQYATTGNTNGGLSPYANGGPGSYTPWNGLVNNADSLRGYKLIALSDFAVPAMRGGVCNILSYSEAGASYRLAITNGATAANFGNWAASNMLIQCYRWHQRELVIGEIHIWSAARDFENGGDLSTRRLWSLGHGIELDDTLEPDLANLRACYRCDDSEGTLLRELVKGGVRNGHLMPFGLSATDGGSEGSNLVMLSGEGEAPVCDLSDNPVFQREIAAMLRGSSQGFAMEISCVFTEAFYAIQDNTITLPDRSTTGVTILGSRPRFVPEILSWDVKDPTKSGMASNPRPLLALTFRGALANTNSVPFKWPAAFSVEVAHASDNANIDPIVPQDLQPWYTDSAGANHARYGTDAPWVGKNVTIQVGIQSTGSADQYDVYISMTPKDAFNPQSGDPAGAEFAYYTKGGQLYTASADYQGYFSAAHLTIARKDLARSIITIGRWNCGSLGYAELQPRMLVDKVRFYGTAAPGNLPTTNGGVLTLRDGKLQGTNILPQRELTAQDILQELGSGLFAADVTEGSATVAAGSGLRFYTSEPRTALHAVKGTYLYVASEPRLILQESTFSESQDQFYGITSIAADGSTLGLAWPYQDASRKAAWAASLRLLAYTAFSDDIRDKTLSLGPGKAFIPGTTTVSDVVLTDPFWTNIAPLSADWRLRVYSPLGRTPLSAITPYWTRGLVSPRRNPILGVYGFNKKVYAAVQGSVYEADDRWRQEGPTQTFNKSLQFRADTLDADLLTPLVSDRAVMPSTFWYTPNVNNSEQWNIDAWVWLDSIAEYQTVLWVGDENSDPTQPAFASNGFHISLRFHRGRPQLAFGSTAISTGGALPEKGLYVATGVTPVPAGEWVHVRFGLVTRTTSAQVLMLPRLAVNGRKVSVSVNATENNAAVTVGLDWMRLSTMGSPEQLSTTLGAMRDAFRAPTPSQSFTGSAVGTNVYPNRFWGWMHPLNGKIAACIAYTTNPFPKYTLGADMPDFDPFSVTYPTDATLKLGIMLGQGAAVGHKVYDLAHNEYGVIYSHPFIGVAHELGTGTEPASWAEFSNELFVTTGGKAARINATYEGTAGVPAPTNELDFLVETFPIWDPNVRSVNLAGAASENGENDPVAQAAAAAAQQIDHFNTHGNAYLRAALGTTALGLMNWKKSSSAPTQRMIAFKGYVKPRDTGGRQVLCAFRTNDNSGGFYVEMIDGRLAMGWYDPYLKGSTLIDTGAQVFRPGFWHYVCVRKETPQQEAWNGNWVNSFFTNGFIRRVSLSSVGAGAIVPGTVVTDSGGVNKGFVVYPDKSSIGTASYPAGGLTHIEYIRLTAAELGVGLTSSWGGSSGNNTLGTPNRPGHDSAVVRWFPKDLATYTDPTKTDPLMARVGIVWDLTLTAGAGFAAGDTITDSTGGTPKTYKVLWAHPLGSPTANHQAVCVYAYGAADYAAATPVTSGGNSANVIAPLAIDGQTDGSYANCISFVTDIYKAPGVGASGNVTQPFCLSSFTGAVNGIVAIKIAATLASAGGARCFHPDMVGMYWVWGTDAGVTANAGKIWKIVSISQALDQIRCVDPVTGAAPDFSGYAAGQGGAVCMGVALRKSANFDLSKEVDSTAQPRLFGHEDAALAFSGIAPFNGEYDSFGFTLSGQQVAGEDYRPFENRSTAIALNTKDPSTVGFDRFAAPIFAGSLPLERLRYDDWAATNGGIGTFDCIPARNYAGLPAVVASSQPQLSGTDYTITPPTATPAVGTTDAWVFGFLQARATVDGTKRYFRVAFYDIDQDSVSEPGPALLVQAAKEDTLNPSGQQRFTISNLGSPRRRGRFEIWLYMGLAGGDSSTMFRVARVPAGAAEVAVSQGEGEIATFAPLSLLAGEPPRCSLVASSGGRMFYGALESDPSQVAFSEAGLPVSIDFATPSLFAFGGGAGDRITMLTEIDGNVVAGKRNALAIITIDAASGIAVPSLISSGVGCVAPASVATVDGRAYLFSESGLILLVRGGITNLSVASNVSRNVSNLMQTDIDRADDLLYVGCYYRQRDQYMMVYRGTGEIEMDRRLSSELKTRTDQVNYQPYQPDLHTFGIYQGPRLTAIASVHTYSGDFEALIGGTDDGFLVFMDRGDTQLQLMGTTLPIWGSPTPATSAAAQGTSYALLSGATADSALEGMRGAISRYVDAGGVERAVYVLAAVGQTLFFDRKADAAPQSSKALTIGGQNHHWETRWMDLQDPQYLKNLAYLDFLFQRQGAGEMIATIFRNSDLVTVAGEADVDLTSPETEYPAGNAEGYRFKVRIDSPQLVTGTAWDLSGIMWRLKDEDQD